MTFQFAWPWIFALLPLPLLVWRFMPAAESKDSGAIRVPFFEMIATELPDGKPSARRSLALLAGIVWMLLVAAAARPQWVGDLDRIPASGRSLMLAVDISGSMRTADLEMDGRAADRLSVVKRLGADFLERRVGDRLGLILFGSQAYLQAPLTFDRQTVATLLEESAIGIAGERTAIGDAIGLAIKRLRSLDAAQRVLVLMTDGANTAGNVEPREAARLAAAAGLTIYSIGIGAERMRVESLLGVREVNPSAELDEEMLTDIAATTGGRYYRAQSAAALEEIYELLDEIEPMPQPDRNARRIEEIFHWPLGAAALLVLVWMGVAVARNRDGLRWRWGADR